MYEVCALESFAQYGPSVMSKVWFFLVDYEMLAIALSIKILCIVFVFKVIYSVWIFEVIFEI